MPLPALVDLTPITCVRPGDFDTKIVTLSGGSPTTTVAAFPLAVTIGTTLPLKTMTSDGAAEVYGVPPIVPVTSVVTDNLCFVVLAGATIKLSGGHIGVVPAPVLAGMAINLT